MTSKINSINPIITNNSAQGFALDLVTNVIQGELAIGYYLKVTHATETHVEVTVISPEFSCPATVKVPKDLATEQDFRNTWKQIKQELTQYLNK